MLDVNLSGAFHMSRGALRHMLDRGTGRIINISSIAGETGNVGQANDAASKAGPDWPHQDSRAQERLPGRQGRQTHRRQRRDLP
jgi:NAD(P)-dependent dehydrogenase (short-subunit alcohol dehydrogenase family)